MSGGGRLSAVDSLRGLAAVAIACVYHICHFYTELNAGQYLFSAGMPLGNIPIFNRIYPHGAMLVELFLVISGFSAFMAYTEKIDQGMKFYRYVMKRAVRIYPLMLATFLIALVEQLIFFQRFGTYFWGCDNSLTMIILSCLGLQSLFPGGATWNAPSWSLSIFFLCWLIYYPIVRFTKNKRDKDAFRVALCVVMVLLGIGLRRNSLQQDVFFCSDMPRGYIAFFSGGLAYYIYKATGEHDKRVLIAAAAVLLSLLGFRCLGVEVGDYTIVLGLVVFPAMLLLVLKSRFIGTLLSFRPLTYLGKISFSIYLCNFPIEIAIGYLDKVVDLHIDYSSPRFLFVFFVVHIIVASIIYLIFEKKVPDALKKKYSI